MKGKKQTRDHPDDVEDPTEIAPESAFRDADVPGGPPDGGDPDAGRTPDAMPEFETPQKPVTRRSVQRSRRRAKDRG